MVTPHLNYIIQTQLSKLTTTDSQKNRTTPQSNAHYETILPKMKHSAIILVQLLLVWWTFHQTTLHLMDILKNSSLISRKLFKGI